MLPPLHSLAYYVHNLNPLIFQLGPVKPRWYGLAYLMGFLAAYLLIMKLSRRGMLRLAPERVPDLVLNGCIFGILIGGRLGFILFYDLPISLHEGRTPAPLVLLGRLPLLGTPPRQRRRHVRPRRHHLHHHRPHRLHLAL